MERVRFYLDKERQLTIEQTQEDNGKFSVCMLVNDLDEEQAKNVYLYLMRPFFNYNHLYSKDQSQIFEK